MKILSICWGKSLSCSLTSAPSRERGCFRGLYPASCLFFPQLHQRVGTLHQHVFSYSCSVGVYCLLLNETKHAATICFMDDMQSSLRKVARTLMIGMCVADKSQLWFLFSDLHSFFTSFSCSLVVNKSNSRMNDTTDIYVRILSHIKIIRIL